MDELQLDAQIRSELGSQRVKAVRNDGHIPGIVYGGHEKSTAIKIDRRTFEKIERQHKGESIVVRLNVMEGDKKLKDYYTIIKEIQHDPVSDKMLHVDFNRISMTEKLEVKVPIASKGEAVGVEKDGGSLDHQLWELDVICLPTNIPQHIEVDVTNLKIHDTVHVKDLVLPEGVETKHDLEAIVFSVVPPMKEIEETPAEEELTEPEVIKEKKKEEETEGKPAEEKAKDKARDKE